jgi:hypothetical protein
MFCRIAKISKSLALLIVLVTISALPATTLAANVAPAVDGVPVVLDDTVPQVHKTAVFALKTNLLEWAMTTPNLGAEVTLAPKWSLEVAGSVNPFKFSDNKKWKHYQGTIEARYWLKESMNGHFFGVHVGAGEYNVAGIKVPFWGFKKDYRYEGWHVRAGITYGYHWVLSRHWSLEALLGLGVVYTNYDKYECRTCGKNHGEKNRTFFAPTRLAINLAYTFGRSKDDKVRTIMLPGVNTVTTDTVTLKEVIPCPTPSIEELFPFVHRVGQPSSGTHMPVRYHLDNMILYEDYSQNREHLASILNALDMILSSDSIKVARVDVEGYASPEGPLDHNKDLGQGRADALKAYILEKEPRLTADQIQATSGGEDWYGLRCLVVESDMVGKDQVLNIIDNVPEAQRKAKLKALNGGRTYRSIWDVLYPQLRSACYIDVWYDKK